MAEQRDEFLNRTQGWIGAVKVNRKGEDVAISVEPGGRVFLTAEEQTLTAQAHRRPEDSPFVEREIVHYDLATQDVIGRFTAPLLERVERPERSEAPTSQRRKAATAVST